MKKIVLSVGIALLGSSAFGQVAFSIEAPLSIAGAREFTSNGDGTGWGLPTLVGVPAVIDTVAIVNDGSTGLNAQGNPISAQGCGALPAGSMNGKIAFIYRNVCGFGVKALNAQNAGAVAVIIVNREPGVIAMNAGTALEGGAVTIPVVFVDDATGLLMRQKIDLGIPVVALIGDKTGLYPNDLVVRGNKTLRSEFGTLPASLAQNATDLTVPLGSWVYNVGSANQTNIILTTTVTRGGTTVLTNVSTPLNLVAGDSAFITSPPLALSAYPVGNYKITYTISQTQIENYAGDNTYVADFDISNDLFSFARLDSTTIIKNTGNTRLATLPSSSFGSCTSFQNPNASRLEIQGAYFAGLVTSVADALSLTGQIVTFNVSKWDDDISAGTMTFDAVTELSSANYVYTTDAQDSTIYFALPSAITMIDNQKYLFCVTATEVKFFQPFDSGVLYDENSAVALPGVLPRNPLSVDGSFGNGLGFGLASSTGIKMAVVNGLNDVKAIDASAFPNPANEEITVSVNATGAAALTISDLSGRAVSTSNVNVVNGKFKVNVKDLSAGTYVFNMKLENGTASTFKVVVSK
jgi:PA domain/Secretion system C-terminal sorting domain